MREKIQMTQLTIFSDPAEKISSQYGMLTIEKWLAKENVRINSDPNRYAEIRNKNGKLALFVNKVA